MNNKPKKYSYKSCIYVCKEFLIVSLQSTSFAFVGYSSKRDL